MNRIITVLAIGICLVIALLSLRQVSNAAPDSSPQIDVSGVSNGGFEVSAYGSTAPAGWTTTNTRTRLINDPIGGCASVDNTPYGVLQTYTPGGVPINDDVVLLTYSGNATVSGVKYATGLKSLQLSMNATVSAANRYFVAYGPRTVSASFSATAGQVVTFEANGFASNSTSAASDMMLIQSYLINTSTCAITTTTGNGAAIDSSGGTGHFVQVSATIPSNGTYQLIVILGVFDKNGDSSAGGTLYVDSVTYGLAQNIKWTGSFANPYIGQTYDLSTMASAIDASLASTGLPLTFRALPTSVCSMTSVTTLRFNSPGTCFVMASQAGNATYAGAARLFSGKGSQVLRITITPTLTKTRTPTNTYTRSRTNTATKTRTSTSTPTNTLTPSNTSTASLTPSKTFTASRTPTITATFTKTHTSTKTSTITSTRTFTKTSTNTPTMTPTRTNTSTRTMVPVALKKAAIGNLFVLGLLHNDTLVTWGKNDFLQAQFVFVTPTSLPTNKRYLDVAAAIQSGYAVDINGILYLWGDNSQGELNAPVEARTDVRAVGAGGRFAFVIKNDGTVIGWGEDGDRQVADIPVGLNNVVQIDGGDRHSVALKNDGTVVSWGYSRGPLPDCLGQDSPVTVPVEYTDGSNPVIEVSAGQDHTLVIRADGTVDGWGCNDRGQLNIPAAATNVVSIAAGRKVSLAARADGSVVAWGLAEYRDFSAAGFGAPPAVVQVFPAAIDAVQVDSQNQNSIIGQRSGRVVVGGHLFLGVNLSRTPTKTATPSPTP